MKIDLPARSCSAEQSQGQSWYLQHIAAQSKRTRLGQSQSLCQSSIQVRKISSRASRRTAEQLLAVRGSPERRVWQGLQVIALNAQPDSWRLWVDVCRQHVRLHLCTHQHFRQWRLQTHAMPRLIRQNERCGQNLTRLHASAAASSDLMAHVTQKLHRPVACQAAWHSTMHITYRQLAMQGDTRARAPGRCPGTGPCRGHAAGGR